METVKLFEFFQKCEELDTFPCTFPWQVCLMGQKLNNSTWFFSLWIISQVWWFQAILSWDTNAMCYYSFCWSMIYVLLFYLIGYGLVVILLHFEQRWIHLNVSQAFRTQSLAFWCCTRYGRFKFKTGLLNISDQHLLKIKNYDVRNAFTMFLFDLLGYRRPPSLKDLQGLQTFATINSGVFPKQASV